ncbi:TIGR03826 family flagellar region protein [Terrilactibacillus laevilacticus]|uniref:TIGR03826 family flagellar region protein n=1 Tax=Terrilactibacillus laevilacticus TaxID=1380157 RepID=A0ABW5PMR3_9BACI|nr:TIGR03826 family flagellar region protein [Terrilactibacillus laevilacticus]
MAELSNCNYCGKLFVRTTTNVCPSCRREHEQLFDLVYDFIRDRDNRMASVPEIHEATEVEEKLIYDWIREGRLTPAEFPGLKYPCKSCGTMIQSGQLCSSCQKKIQTELRTFTEQEKKQQEVLKNSRTYYTKK